MHRSQAEEFQLLKQRFREDPDALWRFNPKPARQWEKDEFLTALDEADLVPMADPNTASQVQRIAIAWSMLELAKTAPYLFHERDTALRFMRMVGIPDPEGILATTEEIAAAKAAMAPQPAPGKQPNPALDQANAQKAQAQAGLAQAQTQAALSKVQSDGAETQADLADKQQDRALKAAEMLAELQERDADRQSHLAIAHINQETATLKTGADLTKAGAEHGMDAQESERVREHQAGMAATSSAADSAEKAADREHQTGIAGFQAATKGVTE